MLARHGITYVFLSNDLMEMAYHDAWLIPTYGVRASSAARIGKSQNFCMVAHVGEFRLFRVGPCPAADDG
jgi:hypothetical protein